jgi:hypothetical protein
MPRPKTGRSTTLRRMPTDCDYKKAVELYYDVLPVLEKWAYEAECHSESEPRWQNVKRLLDEAGITSPLPTD